MADLNQQLAQFREMTGRPPLPNPHVIQGFGDSGDPPPPLPSNPEPDYILNPELEPEDDIPPSPMIPRKPQPTPTPTSQAAPSLAVIDAAAAWKGRGTVLTPERVQAVTRIVLDQLQDDLDADKDAVAGPRRIRKPRVAKVPTGAPEPVPSEPAKRGRPRKALA